LYAFERKLTHHALSQAHRVYGTPQMRRNRRAIRVLGHEHPYKAKSLIKTSHTLCKQ
jgi:hypothetical protein